MIFLQIRGVGAPKAARVIMIGVASERALPAASSERLERQTGRILPTVSRPERRTKLVTATNHLAMGLRFRRGSIGSGCRPRVSPQPRLLSWQCPSAAGESLARFAAQEDHHWTMEPVLSGVLRLVLVTVDIRKRFRSMGRGCEFTATEGER